MGRKTVCIMLLLLVVVIPGVVADVGVTIKVDPNRDVIVKAFNAKTNEFIKSILKKPNEYGVIVFEIPTSASEVSLKVSLRENGSVIKTEKFGAYPSDQPISIDLREKTPDSEGNQSELANGTLLLEQNQTPEKNNTEELETESNQTNGIIGMTVFSKLKETSIKVIYYAIGIILLMGIFVFLIRGFLKLKRKKGALGISVTKLSELRKEASSPSVATELARAEAKIKEAQEEIARYKKKEEIQEKIRKMEKRLEEDKKELDRLRKA